jgi:hypothetical protein
MTRYIGCVAVALVVALAIAACETDPFSPATDERFVVQAYLFAGEPVTDIRVTSILPLGSTDSLDPPINDAVVTLSKEGERYSLVPTPGNSGRYHYPGADLVVAVGDVFDLEVTARGITATARTTVPPPPDGLNLSTTELRMPSFGFGDSNQLVVRWPNPNGDWHFVAYQNVEPDPEPVAPDPFHPAPARIVLEPTAADSTVIRPWGLTHYGRYDVKLYRVNTEYAQLYVSRQQDTRDLNEPATNINNGLGVFSAFSSRGDFFTFAR